MKKLIPLLSALFLSLAAGSAVAGQVGNYANAAALDGSERYLVDQGGTLNTPSTTGITKNVTASLLLTYLNANLLIPLATGVSGTLADARLSANVPLLNAANIFTANLELSSAEPRFLWNETDQGTNLKLWDEDLNNAVLCFRTRTDADAAGVNWMCATRGATTALSDVSIGSGTSTLSSLGSGLNTFNGIIAGASATNLRLQAGAATAAGQAVTIAGTAAVTGSGGNVQITAGSGSPSPGGAGGAVSMIAGNGAGSSSGGSGGAATVQAGNSGGAGASAGGAATLAGGTGTFNAAGGAVTVSAGTGGTNGSGGALTLSAGAAGGTAGNGGLATLQGGTVSAGVGGSVNIIARPGVGTNQAGGIVTITPGARTGSGAPGMVNIAGGLAVTGTKFTASGCSAGTTVGGATAGVVTLGANTCTLVITMNGATASASANGWSCQAHDQTAPLILIGGESSSTTTTASFTIPATAGATDVISFSCMGY